MKFKLKLVKSLSEWLPRAKSWLMLFAVVAMIGALPILSGFRDNRYEVAIQALVLPIIALVLVAAVVALVFVRLYRRDPVAGFAGSLLAGVLLTNNYASRLAGISPFFTAIIPLPQLDGWQSSVFSLVFIVLILALGRWVGRLVSRLIARRHWSAKDLVGGSLVAIMLTFVLMLIPTAKTIVSAWPQYFYKPPAIQATLTANGEKPDVYYIVLEDYANQNQLASQFDFSNDAFSGYLAANGYYQDPDAHQNFPYTTMSLASTLNADYNTGPIKQFASASAQTIVPYHRAVQYSSVVSSFRALGYKYHEIGSWYETTNRGPLADQFYLNDRQIILFGHKLYIDSFTQQSLSTGPFWQFLVNGVKIGRFTIAKYAGVGQKELTGNALGTLKSLINSPPGGRLIFAHLIIPHEPFYYNADGSVSANPSNDNVGAPIKQKYTGQIQYINSQIEPMLTEIKQRSGGRAVVVLQSDEGPQPQALNDGDFDTDSRSDEINNQDMRLWSNADLGLKYGAFSAYNIPAADITKNADAADFVNVFRLIFNTYFNAKLPYLPDCYYAYPNGRRQPEVFADITKRLTGQESDAACAKYLVGQN